MSHAGRAGRGRLHPSPPGGHRLGRSHRRSRAAGEGDPHAELLVANRRLAEGCPDLGQLAGRWGEEGREGGGLILYTSYSNTADGGRSSGVTWRGEANITRFRKCTDLGLSARVGVSTRRHKQGQSYLCYSTQTYSATPRRGTKGGWPAVLTYPSDFLLHYGNIYSQRHLEKHDDHTAPPSPSCSNCYGFCRTKLILNSLPTASRSSIRRHVISSRLLYHREPLSRTVRLTAQLLRHMFHSHASSSNVSQDGSYTKLRSCTLYARCMIRRASFLTASDCLGAETAASSADSLSPSPAVCTKNLSPTLPRDAGACRPSRRS